MITLTEDELETLSNRILKKIDRDREFDRYTENEIMAILGYAIMQIGKSVQSVEDHEHIDKNWGAS